MNSESSIDRPEPASGGEPPGSTVATLQPIIPPTPLPARAWESDPFWRDVVHALTKDKKLRWSHYLETLTANDLDQLRRALSTPCSIKKQREFCPPRRGGGKVGSLPHRKLVGGIATAVRRVQKLRDLQVENLVENASLRCRRLGVDPKLTNQLVERVAADVLAQKTQQELGSQAIAAGRLLLTLEAVRSKAQQEAEKIRLREKAEARQADRLRLEWDKYQFDAALLCREHLPALREIESNSGLSEADKTQAFIEKIFGKKPAWLS